MINENRSQSKVSIHHKRLPIKGFDWISSETIQGKIDPLGSKGFKNFRIDDQKKKWKIRNCENFKGFGKRIEQLLKHKEGLNEQNTLKVKEELFQKEVEEMSLKNTFDKMDKLKEVTSIYEKEKKYRVAMIENFFCEEVSWIKERFK